MPHRPSAAEAGPPASHVAAAGHVSTGRLDEASAAPAASSGPGGPPPQSRRKQDRSSRVRNANRNPRDSAPRNRQATAPAVAALAILGAAALAGCSLADRSAPSTPAAPVYGANQGPGDSAPRNRQATAPAVAAVAEDGPPVGGPPLAELMRVPDAVPRPEPTSRYGNPPAYLANGRLYRTLRTSRGYVERGIASWYGRKFHNRPTSSREPYDMFAMTAAHRTLPLPTYVRVTHLGNGRSIVVRVNDRGPFHPGRIIDLSYTAAAKLDLLDPGSGPVEVRAIRTGSDGHDRPSHDGAPAPVRLYVQVGAYSNEANARRALALAARVRPGLASLTRTGTEDGILHRVRIGPLSGLEEADRVMSGLGTAGMRSTRVVIENRSEEAAEDDNA